MGTAARTFSGTGALHGHRGSTYRHLDGPRGGTATAVGTGRRRILTTTDHKLIGHMYLVTSFAFFLIAGVMALVIRAGLRVHRPGGSDHLHRVVLDRGLG